MANETHVFVELAAQLLADESRGNGGPEELAAAISGAYGRLNFQLAPLIGTDGVSALFARSVKLSRVEFPVLSGPESADTKADPATQRERLLITFGKVEAASASAAATALFANFLRLLTGFIGERLVKQVLQSSRATKQAAASEKEIL